MDNQRNLILAVVLCLGLLLGFDLLIGREGGVERDFAKLREELFAALARATAGKGDPPRRRKK